MVLHPTCHITRHRLDLRVWNQLHVYLELLSSNHGIVLFTPLGLYLCIQMWIRDTGVDKGGPGGPGLPMAGQKRIFLLKQRDFQVNFEAQNALKLTYEHL